MSFPFPALRCGDTSGKPVILVFHVKQGRQGVLRTTTPPGHPHEDTLAVRPASRCRGSPSGRSWLRGHKLTSAIGERSGLRNPPHRPISFLRRSRYSTFVLGGAVSRETGSFYLRLPNPTNTSPEAQSIPARVLPGWSLRSLIGSAANHRGYRSRVHSEAVSRETTSSPTASKGRETRCIHVRTIVESEYLLFADRFT